MTIRTFLPCTIYGIAWSISVQHQIIGFLFLLIGGFILGMLLFWKDMFLQMLIAIFWACLLGCISAIPIIGILLAALIVIYFGIKQLKQVLDNLPLMVIGIILYWLLFYLPTYTHNYIAGGAGGEISAWIDFAIGTCIMILAVIILNRMGYSPKRVFIFTIGLPAFLVMFKFARDNSPFKNIDI